MAFKPARPDQISLVQKKVLLGNTLTVKLGDVIIADQSNFGLATNASVTGDSKSILGVVVGFTDVNNSVLSNGDQTSVATGSGGTTYAVYAPAFQWMEFYAPLDAVSATTTGSDKPFVYFDLQDATQLHEASVTHAGSVGQFLSHGVDPLNSSQVIGHFVETIWGQANT
ncbi:MAG TPA: hypothetical protein VN922_09150 [Bacteroidia bacterium]|nr:hypothetical protein [Bacteroidia bacterium]